MQHRTAPHVVASRCPTTSRGVFHNLSVDVGNAMVYTTHVIQCIILQIFIVQTSLVHSRTRPSLSPRLGFLGSLSYHDRVRASVIHFVVKYHHSRYVMNSSMRGRVGDALVKRGGGV